MNGEHSYIWQALDYLRAEIRDASIKHVAIRAVAQLQTTEASLAALRAQVELLKDRIEQLQSDVLLPPTD